MSLSNENLAADNIKSGDDFSDGMLNLNPWVHFDEEPLQGIEVVEKFNGTGVVVANGFGDLYSSLAEVVTDVVGQSDGGGDLDDLFW